MRFFLLYVTAGGERTVRFFRTWESAHAAYRKLDDAKAGPPIWALLIQYRPAVLAMPLTICGAKGVIPS